MSNNAKHTPGPWDLHKNGVYVTAKDAFGRLIAQSFTSDAVEEAEAKANAHLIAAAPDLLEALEALTKTVEMLHEDGLIDVVVKTARCHAAINKARGE